MLAIIADSFKTGMFQSRHTRAGLAEKLTRQTADLFYLGANPRAGSTSSIRD